MHGRKSKWLMRNGYKPLTDDVFNEWVNYRYGSFPHPTKKEKRGFRRTFKHYKRYGNTIILYSHVYLSNTPLSDLKRNNRRNIVRFVINEWWIVKYMSRIYFSMRRYERI